MILQAGFEIRDVRYSDDGFFAKYLLAVAVGASGYRRPMAETGPDRTQGSSSRPGSGLWPAPAWQPAGASVATVAGGITLAASETVARRRQRPDEIPPLWHRIADHAALAAPARVGSPAGCPAPGRWPSAPAPGRWPGSSASARRRWRSDRCSAPPWAAPSPPPTPACRPRSSPAPRWSPTGSPPPPSSATPRSPCWPSG